jgi:hypothetical protein
MVFPFILDFRAFLPMPGPRHLNILNRPFAFWLLCQVWRSGQAVQGIYSRRDRLEFHEELSFTILPRRYGGPQLSKALSCSFLCSRCSVLPKGSCGQLFSKSKNRAGFCWGKALREEACAAEVEGARPSRRARRAWSCSGPRRRRARALCPRSAGRGDRSPRASPCR